MRDTFAMVPLLAKNSDDVCETRICRKCRKIYVKYNVCIGDLHFLEIKRAKSISHIGLVSFVTEFLTAKFYILERYSNTIKIINILNTSILYNKIKPRKQLLSLLK